MDRPDAEIIAVIKRREPIGFAYLSLRKILEVGGMGSYTSLCCDRISDAELIDGEYVSIDLLNFPDLELTANGVRKCREILKCYVSDDIIADAFEALCEEDLVRGSINNILYTLMEMNMADLFRIYRKSDTRMRKFVRAEICQRSIFQKCVRKIDSSIRRVVIKIKFHRLLSALNNAARSF